MQHENIAYIYLKLTISNQKIYIIFNFIYLFISNNTESLLMLGCKETGGEENEKSHNYFI